MRIIRLLLGTLVSAALIVVPIASRSQSSAATGSPAVETLDDHGGLLKERFNQDRGQVRLLFLVDPVCPGCLRGIADMNRDLLSHLADPSHVKVYVVHEPVIGGSAKNIPTAANLLHTSAAVHHYWNPSGGFGRFASDSLGLKNDKGPVYAWDVWMAFAPDAVWGDAGLPHPQLLMHQLYGLEGNRAFPPLDSKVFSQDVESLLAAVPKGAK